VPLEVLNDLTNRRFFVEARHKDRDINVHGSVSLGLGGGPNFSIFVGAAHRVAPKLARRE
jgi:hypothetical protein